MDKINAFPYRPTDNRSYISKKEVIKAARQKYMRHLIKNSKCIGPNIKRAKSASNKNNNDIVSASAMIEYFNIAYSIGMHAKERQHEEDLEGLPHSANDIVLQLLVLGSK